MGHRALEITNIRVQRIQEISEQDAEAEGAERGTLKTIDGEFVLNGGSYRCGFANLWDSINAKRGFGWSTNPWVWVVEFKRVE